MAETLGQPGERPSIEQAETTEKRMETLKEKGIVSFTIKLTPEQINSIKEVKIEKELDQFNYYGPVNEKLVEKLTIHLSQLEGNTEEVIRTVSKIITKVAENTQKEFRQESTWVMVRVFLLNQEFEIPRWHQDGRYVTSNYQDNDGHKKTGKLVFTVKGAPTRFAEITDQGKWDKLKKEEQINTKTNYPHNRQTYHQEDMRIRKEFVTTVNETEPISKDQAVLYRVGGSDAKAHSEPPMNEPRIFMSVVPGSTEDIEKFRERYEK